MANPSFDRFRTVLQGASIDTPCGDGVDDHDEAGRDDGTDGRGRGGHGGGEVPWPMIDGKGAFIGSEKRRPGFLAILSSPALG